MISPAAARLGLAGTSRPSVHCKNRYAPANLVAHKISPAHRPRHTGRAVSIEPPCHNW
jgi:hypothetical protein